MKDELSPAGWGVEPSRMACRCGFSRRSALARCTLVTGTLQSELVWDERVESSFSGTTTEITMLVESAATALCTTMQPDGLGRGFDQDP